MHRITGGGFVKWRHKWKRRMEGLSERRDIYPRGECREECSAGWQEGIPERRGEGGGMMTKSCLIEMVA